MNSKPFQFAALLMQNLMIRQRTANQKSAHRQTTRQQFVQKFNRPAHWRWSPASATKLKFINAGLFVVLLSPTAWAQSNQATFVYGINAGSEDSVEMAGHTYQADSFYTGGSISSTVDPITATTEDSLFQTERYGDVSYRIPVSNSTYTVILHLAELYHSVSEARYFNVVVEGQPALTNLDIHALAGHDTAFEYVVEDVRVSDGTLDIELESILENAQICGISIYSANGGRVEQ